jgi:hypothetical protein
VRSELTIDQQVSAEGATWLDRRLVAREPFELSRSGFGGDVRAALERRIDALVEQGLAHPNGDKVTLRRNLIETLRRRELNTIVRQRDLYACARG